MMRHIIYLKIQCIPNLEPLKFILNVTNSKIRHLEKKRKCNTHVQICHIINHMFLANYYNIQIIIYILSIFLMYFHNFSFKDL